MQKTIQGIEYQIRVFEQSDLDSVLQVYNNYVQINSSAFSDVNYTSSDFEVMIDSKLPKYVIEKNTQLIGFGFAYKFRKEKTFKKSVKFTYFLLPEHTGKGLGSQLYRALESQCKKKGIDNILVNISSENLGSIRFHQNHGFIECGRFKNVGLKFERYFDLIWMSKNL